MRKSLVLVGTALVLAVAAAAPKEIAKLGYDESAFGDSPMTLLAGVRTAAGVYPPCRSRSDDNCTQVRGRTAAPARMARLRTELPAMGGPYERAGGYPDCSRIIADECVQRFDRARPAPTRRAPPPRRAVPPEELDTPGI